MLKTVLFVAACFSYNGASAQTKIGGIEGAVDSGAYLQLGDNGGTKGLLLPRVALTATNVWGLDGTIINGMTVYNTATAGSGGTTVSPGYYYNDGTKWVRMADAAAVTAPVNNEPWFSQTTDAGALNNTDNVYMMGRTLVGTKTDGVVAKNSTLGQLTVEGGDASIYGLTVGRGGGKVATNTVVGAGALFNNTTGKFNTAIGVGALAANTVQSSNTAVGYNALNANTGGAFNTAIGNFALFNAVAPATSTAIGYYALANIEGSENTAVGNNVLIGNNGSAPVVSSDANTGLGRNVFSSLNGGAENIGIGRYTGKTVVSGNKNLLIGNNIMNFPNSTGDDNVIVGHYAGKKIEPGSNSNTFVGNNVFSAGTLAHNNVAIGFNAGSAHLSGDNNIVIGAGQELADHKGGGNNGSNQLNIGGAIFGLGLSGTESAPAGKIGIGTITPKEKLDVAGAIKVSDGGYTGITNGATTPVPVGGAGTIIFLGYNFYGWNGTVWKQLND
ncbi:hypothetical protein [Flavobacterium sp. HJSW_4]|uniref:hypothetical protein n=1 Tax=Flavobacterium sp. HJSW_4 TaxID=3344660 RepID=UPI0035F452AB